MTTDYEKKYKEALERARQIKNGEGNWRYSDLIEITPALEEVFPELTESEDEKILASIADCVGLMGEDGNVFSNHNVTKACVLAWLERQKESLHIPEMCKENADSFTDIKERNIRGCIGMALADVSESRFKMYGVTLKECLAYLEKQKEEEGYEAIPVESTLEYKLGFKAGKESEKQKEQKPVEGVCSSKGRRGRIGDTPKDIRERAEKFRDGMEAPYDADDICSAYESGAMDERKKPVEWSEEDEKKRKGLIEGLEKRMGFGWASDPFSREEYISWLKSLRPQPSWKPSEEQMEALEYVIRDYREDSCNATANYLQEILDHLKNM